MPPRRSERLRLLREAVKPAEPVVESTRVRRRRRVRRRTRAQPPARPVPPVVINPRRNSRSWLHLEAHTNPRTFANQNGEAHSEDVLTLRLLSLFIRIALLEAPSLAQLTRRNPHQGIRKLFQIIRFLFFRH